MGLGSDAGPESPRRHADTGKPDEQTADLGAGDPAAAASGGAGSDVGGNGGEGSAGEGSGSVANSDATGRRTPAGTPAGKPRTRRFPTFTRDTARPEGGGRVAGGRAPAAYRQWPLLTVCAGVLLGLSLALLEFRSGAIIMGLSLIGGGVLRWGRSSVGMLAVRSRFTDVTTYAVLGCLITLLAMMAQPSPWITVPLLEDILHFSVQ